MKKRVYLETTIISYLTARPNRDLIQAARQEITHQWWDRRREDFQLYVSQIVADEAGRGDEKAAGRRLLYLEEIPRLEIDGKVTELARALLERHALPAKATEDALHIALAAAHGMDFLLTWNCSHIANAEMMGAIQATIDNCGYDGPLICTPEEMLGDWE